MTAPAGGERNASELEQQAMQLGLSAAMTQQLLRDRPGSAPAEVMPENWPAVQVFVAAGTQWRRAGMTGLPTGLDYGAIPPIAGMLGIPADADLLARLQVLEGAALGAMLEKVR